MEILVTYILPLVILFIAEIVYFKIAERFNIIDKPNERSSHFTPTIRGGGIIFILAFILFFLWNGFSFPFLLAAILLSGIISFIDDIYTIPNKIKFSAHLISVILLLWEVGLLNKIHPVFVILITVVIIGIINAYNFMDGINGITGLYSLAIIVPLFMTENIQSLKLLELFSIFGLLIFLYFNARVKARCFAGDVGSISLAILIVFLLLMRISQTQQFIYAGMLVVYGIDSIFTIVQRIFQKENIFKPHRKHLYQYLSNEKRNPQLIISFIYATIQLLINFAITYSALNLRSLLITTLILAVAYLALKIPIIYTIESTKK
ncbi:MAG: glycosyltransferase family 4 protein [Ferruginibacter sp.]